MSTTNYLGCYNCDVPLWANFFKAYPLENCTYFGNEGGCEVYIKGEIRALFPNQRLARACMEAARIEVGQLP